MPVNSKNITVTLSGSQDKSLVYILNRTTGDIWKGIIDTDTLIFDLANNNIWGDEPAQSSTGHVLEINAYGDTNGSGTLTLSAGVDEVTITIAAETDVELIV